MILLFYHFHNSINLKVKMHLFLLLPRFFGPYRTNVTFFFDKQKYNPGRTADSRARIQLTHFPPQ